MSFVDGANFDLSDDDPISISLSFAAARLVFRAIKRVQRYTHKHAHYAHKTLSLSHSLSLSLLSN